VLNDLPEDDIWTKVLSVECNEPDHSIYGSMIRDILHAYMGLLVLEDYLIERKSYG
jgi:hypothetical protein